MFYSRWLSLLTIMVLLVIIALYDKEPWRIRVRYYGIAFLEGMVGGFMIDCVGINAGYYYFPRQPFLGHEYFVIVVPCWGVFGLLINCLWKWVGKEKFARGTLVTLLPLFAYYEGANLLTHSWVYTAPLWSVALGWIPLMWIFTGCNRRRRVVFRIEEWKLQFQGETLGHQVLRGILIVARTILVIAMFPLLLTIILRLLIEIPMLIRHRINIWGYTKCLLAMR